MKLSVPAVATTLNAVVFGNAKCAVIERISIDSRSLENGTHSLFFALVGFNNNGHHHIKSLINKGVCYFVVQYIPEGLEGQACFLIVKNTVAALQKLATHHRQGFRIPVIGITGSNGKTIIKEWLHFLLSPDYCIVRSPKSYNSQVGVPLSIFGINAQHTLGIFEAGISTTSEMKKLQEIIQPTLGILTRMGPAHDEGFASFEEKIKEKLLLFSNVDVLIYQKSNAVEALLQAGTKTFSWSFEDPSADVWICKNNNLWELTLKNNQKTTIFFPFTDEASLENTMQCVATLLYLGYDSKVIQTRILELFPVEMRLKIKNGINNSTLIDDSYSSDFQSLRIALDFLENQKQYHKKTLILSDIVQSGQEDSLLYSQVARLLASNKIDRMILIGKTITRFKDYFSNPICFADTLAFLNAFDELSFGQETILIKGARLFEFELIVNALEEKTHETILEINLNAISHNLNFYKSKLKPSTKIMVMVKAFGYGNGGFEIAKLLEHHQVNYLGVAFADEGIALRNAGIQLPIMVLNPESTSFSSLILHKLEPEIYSLKGLYAFLKMANQKNIKNYPIHIKLDTGMHRLGFEQEQLPELIAVLQNAQAVSVKSILSHMATSDDSSHANFALQQIASFEKMTQKINFKLQINPIRHLLNTSGISNYTTAQFDMVRLGIGLYGISNDSEEQPLLENVSTLKSVISQIRIIQKGESVGYGRRFVAQKTTQIATIPIGYADGIARLWGNGVGFVTINNQKAFITGSICMDMLMVDVTEIDCAEGDTVVVFGKSPTVKEMAEKLQTIPYEVLTSISQRVRRVFYRE